MYHIPLRLVRESCGYSIDEAASFCEINPADYGIIENDASLLTANIMSKIKKLYNGIPLEIIYPGKEIDCIKHNQKT